MGVQQLVSYCASVLAIAWPADFLFQPIGPASQVAFLGKLLADAASQSYKSYSGHLWMFSKHRGELRVCVYVHACGLRPLATSSSWKQRFRVLLFPGKEKIENFIGFFPSLSPLQLSCLEAASNQTMCEELGRMCACIFRRVKLYKWAGTGGFFWVDFFFSKNY